jgi:hypothetical protein
MDRESVQVAIRATLLLLDRLSQRTRTPADDLLMSILQRNEDRLIEAVLRLLSSPVQPPTDEQVVEALASVGIRV